MVPLKVDGDLHWTAAEGYYPELIRYSKINCKHAYQWILE
jgi:hypothetical protein